MKAAPRHIVAIPANNEAEHIGACLSALAGQAQRVLLLVNNSSDGTDTVAAQEATRLGLDLTVVIKHFSAEQCSAGYARKTAMDLAASLDPGAVLLTTDADSRVASDWIDANIRHVLNGADAVAGRAVIDPVDAAAIPARLHEDDARECALGALLDEIAFLLDPDPADPWPRHTEHSGASICATPSAFARTGGIPDLPLGEDRAFFTALRRVDGIIRHPMDVVVTVSGRVLGRARGGMADTIRRRLAAPDPFLDDALEPVRNAFRRAKLRARARAVWRNPDHPAPLAGLADDLGIFPAKLRTAVCTPFFGLAWSVLEDTCDVLARERVPAGNVAAETERARVLLASLRVRPVPRTNPCDRFQLADAQPA